MLFEGVVSNVGVLQDSMAFCENDDRPVRPEPQLACFFVSWMRESLRVRARAFVRGCTCARKNAESSQLKRNVANVAANVAAAPCSKNV